MNVIDCIEIFSDASLKKFDSGRVLTCSGALYPKGNLSDYKVIADATNNEAELEAIFMAVKLAKQIVNNDKNMKGKEIRIYSDSKGSVQGLTKLMPTWLRRMDSNGIIYSYAKEPVKNQSLFFKIINYLVDNDLKIKFLHIKGHINYFNKDKIDLANRVFRESNGYALSNEDMSRICFYNYLVDNTSKDILRQLNESDVYLYERANDYTEEVLTIPKNYQKYIL